MTSLTDVYRGGVGAVVDRKQRIFGAAVFALGATMVAAAVPVATTGLGDLLGLDTLAARELAGVLAGVGLPAAFVGIFVVLPARRSVRALAAISASVALFGVALFAYAYPTRWVGVRPVLTAVTVTVYSLGTLATFWCLFAGLVTVKTRNEPGGTARLSVTESGTVEVVSEAPDRGVGVGGVGVTGTPDGGVETQNNREPEPTGDGGTLIDEDPAPRRPGPDPYCGNCEQFRYVRVDGELTPACALHEELLSDMDACEEWSPTDQP